MVIYAPFNVVEVIQCSGNSFVKTVIAKAVKSEVTHDKSLKETVDVDYYCA